MSFIAWSNVNDLDLHVIEPNGEETSFSHRKSATGGELDVDMNAGSQRSQEPCENICWPSGAAPTGHYKVLVVYYSNHGAKGNFLISSMNKILIKFYISKTQQIIFYLRECLEKSLNFKGA